MVALLVRMINTSWQEKEMKKSSGKTCTLEKRGELGLPPPTLVFTVSMLTPDWSCCFSRLVVILKT